MPFAFPETRLNILGALALRSFSRLGSGSRVSFATPSHVTGTKNTCEFPRRLNRVRELMALRSSKIPSIHLTFVPLRFLVYVLAPVSAWFGVDSTFSEMSKNTESIDISVFGTQLKMQKLCFSAF